MLVRECWREDLEDREWESSAFCAPSTNLQSSRWSDSYLQPEWVEDTPGHPRTRPKKVSKSRRGKEAALAHEPHTDLTPCNGSAREFKWPWSPYGDEAPHNCSSLSMSASRLNRLREMTEVLLLPPTPCPRAPPQEDSLIKQSVLLELLHSWRSPQHPEQSSSAD